MNSEDSYTTRVEDGLGNIILEQNINASTSYIDCSNLASGIYFVVLANTYKKEYFKFIKN